MDHKRHSHWTNFFLGLLVIIVPLSGLPLGLKNIVLVILGALIALVAMAANRRLPPHDAPRN